MKSDSVSVVVLTKNEESKITACLKLLDWVSDLIVIDDNSTDKTVELCQKLGARVFKRLLNNDFSAQRNFALKQAKNNWVLFVDADERVSPSLKEEILRSVKRKDFNGFLIKRIDFIWGKRLAYGELKNIWLLRLAKKDKGGWQRQIHETWVINGNVGKLENSLLHYPHDNLTDILTKINHYSTLHARSLQKEGRSASLIMVIFLPFLKFINNYFLKLGFLDGSAGLIINLLMSLHSFLAQGKLFILTRKK